MENLKRNLKVNLNQLNDLKLKIVEKVDKYLDSNKSKKDFYYVIEIPNIIKRSPESFVMKLIKTEPTDKDLGEIIQIIENNKKEIKNFLNNLEEIKSYVSMLIEYNMNEEIKMLEEDENDFTEEIKSDKKISQVFQKKQQDNTNSTSIMELAHIESKLTRIFAGVERLNKDDFDKLLERKKRIKENIKTKTQK